jgi:hypothetical protein
MTAQAYLSSPKFLEVAGADAIKLLAKTHGTTAATIKRHLPASSKLQRQLAELVTAAAEECAKRIK